MITKEQIEQDVINYLIEASGEENILLGEEVEKYGIGDFELVEMEMFLEEKYKGEIIGEESATLWQYDTIENIIEKLFNFFNNIE